MKTANPLSALHPRGLAALLLAVGVGCASTGPTSQPPVAKTSKVVDTHWGVEVDDPYRYIENLQDPYVREWFEGQAEYADSVLESLPLTDELLARLTELDRGKPFSTFGVKRLANGDLFYQRRNAGENLGKLYQHPSGEDEPRLLVNPENLGKKGEAHYSLGTYMPSWDGRFLVYGLAQGGSEETTYHIMDLESGETLGRPINNVETAYNRPQWRLDGSGFFYSRRRDLPADAPVTEIYQRTEVRYHALGSDPASDPIVAAYDLSVVLPLAAADFPSMVITPGSDFAVLKVKHGDSNEISLYAAPRNALLGGDIPWREIASLEDEVVDFAVAGQDIYLVTARDAPRFKLVRTSLADPDFEAAEEIVGPGDRVLDRVSVAQDGLYIDSSKAGVGAVLRIGWEDGELTYLNPPGEGAAYVSSVSPEIPGILAYTVGWTRGGLRYAYDPADGSFTDTGLIPAGEFDSLPGLTSREALVTSHDGTKIPLSIIHRTDIELDGSNPTIVYGYGSYGISMDVYFSATRLAWLERGGVFAIAHVRGGGEYGQAWHYAGRMANKPNTWKDLISSAEYLVEAGYTRPEHMAAMGGSAGGILVGRAITERPDLFGAAVIQVGMLDTVRAETTTNGVPNIKEFGTVTEEAGFEGLLAMSPYHHVQDGTRYPAVLLTHGFNDPRVEPWMSGKMAARLQAANEDETPVLLRVEFGAGHGIGSTRSQVLQEVADTYSFLFWQLGGG